MKYSISKWENSFWGGYERVLFDHPEISVPENIKFDTPVGGKYNVPYYVQKKLIKLFLLKLETTRVSHKSPQFIKDIFLDKGVVQSDGFMDYYVISRDSVNRSIKDVIVCDTELFNMFEHYKEFIKDTKFKIEIGPSSGGGTESGEEGDDSEETPEKSDIKNEGKDKDNSKEQPERTRSEGKGKSTIEPNRNTEECKSFSEDEMKKIKIYKPEYDYKKTACSTNLKKDTKFVLMKKSKNKCKYSSEQIRDAKFLEKLLDINFDPKEDKVSNLKLGKVDVNKIAEIPCGNTHVYYKVEENQSTKPFSVCILCDESGSMRCGFDETQNEIVKVLYKSFSAILPQDKIYVYGHSGSSTPEIRIYNDKYNQQFEETIDNQTDNQFGENYDGPVIESIYERIRSYTDDNIIFIVISDGQPWGQNYGGQGAIDELKKVIERCKRDGFVTVGIGFRLNLVKHIYQYHTVVDRVDYNAVKNISNLINRVVKSEFQS